MSSVLLTGATGFIGSHIAREFLRRGHQVRVLTRPGSDRRRLRGVEQFLEFHDGGPTAGLEADILVHAGWYAVPGKYLEASENRACLEEGRRLLDRVTGRAVFLGSCFEFAAADHPLREDSPTDPTTVYAGCKNALRMDVERKEGCVWARLFYQYGPWEDPRRLVPAVMNAQLRGEPSRATLGLRSLDYLHVEDVASAIAAVAESRLSGCVNIGSGIPVTVKDVIDRITELGGRPDLIEWGAFQERAGEASLLVADNAKLRSTGWIRKFDLVRGFQNTFEWWKTLLNPA